MRSLAAFNAMDLQLRQDVAIDRAVAKMAIPEGYYWCRKTKSALNIDQIKKIAEMADAKYNVVKHLKEVEFFSNSKPNMEVFGV